MISLIDTYATIAAVVGSEMPPLTGKKAGAEDSFNMLPTWLGDGSENPIRDFMILSSSTGNVAVRSKGYKYINCVALNPHFNEDKAGRRAEEYVDDQLYNLTSDIGETNNIGFENPKIIKELSEIYNTVKAAGHSRN